MNKTSTLAALSFASFSLSSCVVSDYPGGPVSPAAASITFGTYDRLPDRYAGNAYLYQNRYYYGGDYQRGRYIYQGRSYSDRYYHGGRYYYGGRHQQYSGQASRRTKTPTPHSSRNGQNYKTQ